MAQLYGYPSLCLLLLREIQLDRYFETHCMVALGSVNVFE